MSEGVAGFTEQALGEFPTKIVEVPFSGANVKANFNYAIPAKKKRGRPLGSKNKLKAKIAAIANEVENNG